jgi:AAA+ ATPase superfamily predicted ATPase
MINPFITSGYSGQKYFCDREKETKDIVDLLVNGNNLALISPRRIGKTDLLRHCFNKKEIRDKYHCFIVDIYSTKSLSDLINKLGSEILDVLRTKEKNTWLAFVNTLKSMKFFFSYDAAGVPSWGVNVGDIKNPDVTLKEIFSYLNNSPKPCIVAIDEFQQILKYSEDNVEATLRTFVQYSSKTRFVFSGSQRHLMGAIFTSPSRPFYQSVTIMNLDIIPKAKYMAFCKYHFEHNGKTVDEEVVNKVYDRFEGVTYYLQKIMNILYLKTPEKSNCSIKMLDPAIAYIIDFTSPIYEDLLYQIPYKQAQVLLAISHLGKAENVTSGDFIKQIGAISPSSVNSALKGLLDKDLLTSNKGVYQVYDKFFEIWLRR